MNPAITAKGLRQMAKDIQAKNILKKIRVAVLGYRSTQFLVKFLRQAGQANGLQLDIYEADYKQVELEIFNADSGLYAFDPAYIFLVHSSHHLRKQFYASDNKENFSTDFLVKTKELSHQISQRLSAPLILTNFASKQDGIFGNFSNKVRASFPNQVQRIHVGLMDLAEEQNSVHILDLEAMVQFVGQDQSMDQGLYVNADIPFNFDMEAKIAWEMVHLLKVFIGKFRKCLILDLDNTLWGGVIGDDGLTGIQIGSLGIGKAFTELQQWAKQLKERGIILAICSKNQEDVAKEVFIKHEDMILRLDDIAIFVANWSNKADNIRHIQEVLNIGFDSMVFLDDNPAERGLVRSELPEVLVPELPADPAQYLPFLRKLNLFETLSYSTQDQDRTQQYQEEAKRRSVEHSFTNMEDYLKSLDMKASMQSFQDQHISRISQLSQRSNQYNLRTIRYVDTEIQKIQQDSQYLDYEISLEDKFGKYGLISVIILKKQPDTSLFIDTWLMSCRVLKREVEKFALNRLVEDAREKGFLKIVAEYIPSQKNKIVENHYADLGFVQNQEGLWELSVQNFKPFMHFIDG